MTKKHRALWEDKISTPEIRENNLKWCLIWTKICGVKPWDYGMVEVKSGAQNLAKEIKKNFRATVELREKRMIQMTIFSAIYDNFFSIYT